MGRARLLLLLVFAAVVAGFFALGLQRYLTLDAIKAQQAQIAGVHEAHPFTVTAAYFAVYVATTALSLPGATLLTLFGGALYGLWWGTLIVSFASTIGATCAFLGSRFLFRDTVQRRFGEKLRGINQGVEREGAFYLLTLRLTPLVPFFVVNLVMALTPMLVRTFYWVSQVGMLPATFLYVNAGSQLARIESLRGIVSPTLLVSLAMLGLFPLVAKKAVDHLRARRGLAR